ncbi:hypothetical protein [Saccharopolyspora mangrovi]|uniref:DUF4352 domain-containing protein n=1 Tax=Saccharopolyspora mangrovi TaxID=3082379 RepID=A0ABU6AA61_9PSEU|nr:hypothetical protein [Saccharopolyspora sp. S2-29]MEB3368457.1 hypothetical protein [Saccharopolyspora sp. S2-29]
MSRPARTPTETPHAAPPKRKWGGLAWSALVLGALGLCGSVLQVLAGVTAVVALAGLVLGVLALFGTRKIVAGLGAVLCGLAIAAAIVPHGLVAAELDEVFFGERQPPVTAAPEAVVRLPFGERHTWPDGRTITILQPVPYEETSEFSRPPAGRRHVQFGVVVHNGGQDAYSAVTTTISVTHNGRVAQQHFGAGDPMPLAQLPPGGDALYSMVFEIGAEPGELQVSVLPSFATEETAHFVGPF